MADQLTEIVTDAMLTIAKPDVPVDLHMVEIMHVCFACKINCMGVNVLVDGAPK